MTSHAMPTADAHDLYRFVQAQEGVYEQALGELRAGRKRSHWMWFIFPQYAGLGHGEISQRYAIRSRAEARAYLEHIQLGPRLIECTEAALRVEGRSAHDVFGSPDDLKLWSCATLFDSVTPAGSVFAQLLDRYFDGAHDAQTLRLMVPEGQE